jgi:hypothetical protein
VARELLLFLKIGVLQMKKYDYKIKCDKGKPKAGLMLEGFANALLEVSKVSTFGAKNHGENTWQRVEFERYKNSFARHLLAWYGGERIDEDSNLSTLAHVAWNVLALLELELKNGD